MISKIIKTKNELIEFAKMYEKLSKSIKADMNYLLNAKVRGFFEDGRMVGGYAISTVKRNNVLRYLSFLSAEQREKLFAQGLKPNEYAEITYIFVENNKVNYLQNILIMLCSLWDAFLQRKKYIMGGGVIEKFNARMQLVLKTKLFDDLVSVSGEKKNFKILAETSIKIIFQLPKAIWLEIIKFLRRR